MRYWSAALGARDERKGYALACPACAHHSFYAFLMHMMFAVELQHAIRIRIEADRAHILFFLHNRNFAMSRSWKWCTCISNKLIGLLLFVPVPVWCSEGVENFPRVREVLPKFFCDPCGYLPRDANFSNLFKLVQEHL